MKKATVVLMLFALIASSLVLTGCGDDDDDDNGDPVNYFPIATGNMWEFDYAITFDADGDTLESGTYTQEFIGTKDIEGMEYYVLRDNPDTTSVMYYRQGDDYVWGGMDQQVLTSLVTVLFKAVPTDVDAGQNWSEEYEITTGLTATVYGESREMVDLETPAGTFEDCIHVNLRFTTSVPSIDPDSINFWIAPEVGPVKYISYTPNDEPNTTKTSYLTNYTIVD